MKRQLLLGYLAFLCSLASIAQQFPVQVFSNVIPPAPVHIYNYADAMTINSPLRVRLLLRDLSITNRRIRLKVFIEGNGLKVQSRDQFIIGAPLFIDGGSPLVLNNTELAPYFELRNLQGIGNRQYGQTLREGAYQFCFEVYDFFTNRRLSRKSCATTFIFNNDPPLLNIPFNKSNIEPQAVDNIVFQWTPRQINVSNVEYEFSLVEIWDDHVDPNTAFLTSPPIFTTTTRATSFIYGPAHPLLLHNKRYAWRVQAKALKGSEEIGLFRNEGKSEVFWFTKNEKCPKPAGVHAEPKGISKINVYWEEDPATYSEYTIMYRQKDRPNSRWFHMRTNSTWATVWDLKPNTTYEYKVAGKCKYQYGEYSPVQYVTTGSTEDPNSIYNCGIVPEAKAITNREGHPNLVTGDRILAGDFMVVLTDITSQSNGVISGSGFVRIPYLEGARFGVVYENILINTDEELAEGEIVTLYDPEFGKYATMTVDINTDVVEVFTGDQGGSESERVDFIIASIDINEHGAVVVTGTNGEEEIIPGGKDMTIVDGEGTPWTVGEDGTITQGEVAEGGTAADGNTEGMNDKGLFRITAKGVRVDFKEPSGYYCFDPQPKKVNSLVASEYETLMTEDAVYVMPYKLISDIPAHTTDILTAEAAFSDATITTDMIAFKTKDGVKIPATWKDNIATLELKKKFDYVVENVIASVRPKDSTQSYTIAGACNIVHVASAGIDPINISLVPIAGGAVSDQVVQQVKELYQQVGVQLDIRVETPLDIPSNEWDRDGNNVLDIGDSNMLAHYTEEERAIYTYYKQQRSADKKRYYIFVVGASISISDTAVQGFMPLKRQYGFVFAPTNPVKTIAHELGHGIFGLKHPWDTHSTSKGSTNWLMDNGEGTLLTHMDWKKIHAPALELYMFQDDEDGALSDTAAEELFYDDKEYMSKVFQKIRCAYISGTTNLDGQFFEKIGQRFTAVFDEYGSLTLSLKDKKTSLQVLEATTEEVVSGSGNKVNRHTLFTLDYGGVIISAKKYNDYSNTEEKLKKLQEYLFPTTAAVQSDFDLVWNSGIGTKINTDQTITSEEIEQLKRIASCGSEFLDTTSRYRLLKAIFNYSTREYYEDLVLDILATVPSNEEAKQFFDLINKDKGFLALLVDKMNNYGALSSLGADYERNFDRLATEYLKLFYKAYSKAELEGLYQNMDNDHKLYYYGFGSHCDSSISASRDDEIFEFQETEVTKYYPSTSKDQRIAIMTGSAALGSCELEERSYPITINDFVAVDFIKEAKFDGTTIDKGVLVMPALVYYTIIKSKINDGIKTAIELATIITPVDEFYIIGQAMKYGSMGFRAIRYSRIATKPNLIYVSLKRVPEQLKTAIRNSKVTKLDDVQPSVDWSKREFGEYIDISANPIKPLDNLGNNIIKKSVQLANIDDLGKASVSSFSLIDEMGNITGELKRVIGKGGKQIRYFYTDFKGGNGLIKNHKYKMSPSQIPNYEILDAKLLDNFDNLSVKDILYGDLQMPKAVNSNIKGLGKIMSDDAYRLLDDKVEIDGFYGLWKKDANLYADYGGESINLTKFKNALKNGMTKTEAAFETVTGKVAKKKGFNKVQFSKDFNINNLDEVHLIFLK